MHDLHSGQYIWFKILSYVKLDPSPPIWPLPAYHDFFLTRESFTQVTDFLDDWFLKRRFSEDFSLFISMWKFDIPLLRYPTPRITTRMRMLSHKLQLFWLIDFAKKVFKDFSYTCILICKNLNPPPYRGLTLSLRIMMWTNLNLH